MRTFVMMVGIAAACGKGKDDGGSSSTVKAGGGATPTVTAKAKPKANDDSAFGVESGKIVFRYEGTESGTEEIWFEDHGAVVGAVSKLSMAKQPVVTKTNVWKGGKSYGVDDGPNVKPWSSGFRYKGSEMRMISTNDPKQFEMAGYEKGETETIAGQTCDVWTNAKQNISFCRWQGIDLRYQIGKSMTVTAESVELDVKVPKELFDRTAAPQ